VPPLAQCACVPAGLEYHAAGWSDAPARLIDNNTKFSIYYIRFEIFLDGNQFVLLFIAD
jgi:hypothetical protein